MLGVVREQAEDHLQAAPPGAQQCHLRLRVDLVGGQFRRDRVAGLLRAVQLAAGGGDLALGGGDQPGVLDRGRDRRVGEQDRKAALGGGQVLLRLADGGVAFLAGRVVHDLGVLLDVCGVVADGVDAVVGGGVLEVVLLPPPRLQPAQQRGRARIEVRCQDLQDDPAVLEQGDLPGFAVVLELDFSSVQAIVRVLPFTVMTDRTGSMPGMASGARR